MVTPRRTHRHGRKRPPQLLRRSPRPHDLGPQPYAPALPATPVPLLTPAPAAPQLARVPRLQGPRAGPAARGLPAPLTRQPRHIPPPGHLHQHRPVLEPLAHHLPRQRRQPRRPCGRVPRLVGVTDRTDERRRGPHLLALGRQRPRPARLHQLRRLDRAAQPPQQEPRPLRHRPLQQHFPRMRLRCMRITVTTVPVIPDSHQPQIPHRREHSCPRPDHGPHRPPADRQPPPVPLLGPGIGAQHHMPPLPDQLPQRRVHPRRGPPVRQHGQRPTPGGQRRGHRPRQLLRPVRPRQRRPHGTRYVPPPQRRQEPRPRRIPPPTPRLRHHIGRQRRTTRLPLRLRPPRRHRQLHHVRERARIPVGDGPAQRQQLRRQHRLGRQHLRDRREHPPELALHHPLHHEPADQLPPFPPAPLLPGPEPHPHPHPGLRLRVHRRRHRIVEIPVEMHQPLVHQHPRHRQPLRQLGPPPRPRLRPRRLRPPHRLPNQRKLLRLRTRPVVFPAHSISLSRRD